MSNSNSNTPWVPKRSIAECRQILTAPGRPHELETIISNGRVQRVYKHLPKNLRAFWLSIPESWSDREYIIFEKERLTFGEVRKRAENLANLMYIRFGVRKGDRVAIVMRNFPEFIVSFWAIHLLGALAALVNAWVHPDNLLHCFLLLSPKVVIVDYERADIIKGRIYEIVSKMEAFSGVLVFRAHEMSTGSDKETVPWRWPGMLPGEILMSLHAETHQTLPRIHEAQPDDGACIYFTSGTTGTPKGVLLSHRALLSSLHTMVYMRHWTALRAGLPLPVPDPKAPQKTSLVPSPMFHAAGSAIALMRDTSVGNRCCLMRKWIKEDAIRIIKEEKINTVGGVPSVILDMLEVSDDVTTIETVSSGGAPVSESMADEARRRFRNVTFAQVYGLTESAGMGAMIAGGDYLQRPTSCGLPGPVVDLLIMDSTNNRALPAGETGEIWIKGPGVMIEYYKDKVATEQSITLDGWLKSGDVGMLDDEGFLYIKDRAKDIIIRGGENIHSAEVENALHADERVARVAAVGVPDKRLGELVAAVVIIKPEHAGTVTENSLIENCRRWLPAHAVPVMIIIKDEPFELSGIGKVLKQPLRRLAQAEWTKRSKHTSNGISSHSKAKL